MDNIHDLIVRVFWLYRMILIIMEVPKMMRKVDSSEGNLEKLVFFEFFKLRSSLVFRKKAFLQGNLHFRRRQLRDGILKYVQ